MLHPASEKRVEELGMLGMGALRSVQDQPHPAILTLNHLTLHKPARIGNIKGRHFAQIKDRGEIQKPSQHYIPPGYANGIGHPRESCCHRAVNLVKWIGRNALRIARIAT